MQQFQYIRLPFWQAAIALHIDCPTMYKMCNDVLTMCRIQMHHINKINNFPCKMEILPSFHSGHIINLLLLVFFFKSILKIVHVNLHG